MTAPITMDSTALADAAELYGSAQADGQTVITTLATALDTNWGCAGSDGAGATWAASYDPAAFDAVAAGTDIVNACGKVHDLLAFTALNHGNIEKANKNPQEPPDGPPAQLPSSASPTFEGAFGGDADEPFGWGLVSSWLQGHTWPNGDPDKLRALGDAWRAAAGGLRSAGDGTASAFPLLEDIVSGEIPQALAQMDLVVTDTEQVAAHYESLAAACEDWATTIEDAHHKILAILAGALGAGLVIGGVAGFFTAGTGAAAAAGAAGSAAGASIVTVLIAFDAAAAVAVGATVAAGVAIAGVATDLQPLLDANPTTFNSTTSGGGGAHNYVTPPKNLPGFPNARPAKRLGHRKRWQDDKGNTYEWDYQHGAVEKYDKNGRHQGEYNPETGEETKPADPTRRPER